MQAKRRFLIGLITMTAGRGRFGKIRWIRTGASPARVRAIVSASAQGQRSRPSQSCHVMPSVNRSSIRLAICAGVSAVVKWPRALARYPSTCRSIALSRRTRSGSPRSDSASPRPRRPRESPSATAAGRRQVREITPAEAASQPLAPDLGIGEVVDLARQSPRFSLGGADIG
jgi:hypothetical protein